MAKLIAVYIGAGQVVFSIKDETRAAGILFDLQIAMQNGSIVEVADDEGDRGLFNGKKILAVHAVDKPAESESEEKPAPKPAMADLYDVRFKGELVASDVPGLGPDDAILAYVQKAGYENVLQAAAAKGGLITDFTACEAVPF